MKGTNMFEVTVKKRFTAWHSIKLSDGNFEIPHSHNWKCEAFLRSEKLDSCACVIDFSIVDSSLAKVLATLEGKKIHEQKIYTEDITSTELIAKYIFDALSKELDGHANLLSKVAVWEDNDHGAFYYR